MSERADVAATPLSFEVVAVNRPDDVKVIVGQSHFIKTVDDPHEAVAGISPYLRFGIGFCEASEPVSYADQATTTNVPLAAEPMRRPRMTNFKQDTRRPVLIRSAGDSILAMVGLVVRRQPIPVAASPISLSAGAKFRLLRAMVVA